MIRIFRALIVPHRHCVVLVTADLKSLDSKYMLCRLENTGFGRKIMNMDPKQVHIMAPFGLVFIQDGSHKLWEASGMPPGPQNRPGK